MKYISSYNDYLAQYQSKWPKNSVFFNPDNTVALFEKEDEEVRAWVYENGVKLKEKHAVINASSYEKIKEWVTNDRIQKQVEAKNAENKVAREVKEQVEKALENIKLPEPEVTELEHTPVITEDEKKELLAFLNDEDEKLTLKRIQEFLNKFVVALSK